MNTTMQLKGIVTMMKQLDIFRMANPEVYGAAALGAFFLGHTEWLKEVHLSNESIAEISALIDKLDDPRFTGLDYADALIYTSYPVDVSKLIAIGQQVFDSFEEVMVYLAEQKRCVYEDTQYNDDNLMEALQEYDLLVSG